ncbi:MAG TPA: hypothetical protein VE996_04850 [Terriglobales bacterium]|nr:hypothetical protein [Terriglobales bacterium]
MTTPAHPPTSEAAKLRSEWRSFLLGSLIVLCVCVLAISLILAAAFGPAVAKLAPNGHVTAQAQAALYEMIATHPPLSFVLVWLAGAVGLFVLNQRFSRILGRPRAAAARVAWTLANLFCSLFFVDILPEVVMLVVLGGWAREARRAAAGAAPNRGS